MAHVPKVPKPHTGAKSSTRRLEAGISYPISSPDPGELSAGARENLSPYDMKIVAQDEIANFGGYQKWRLVLQWLLCYGSVHGNSRRDSTGAAQI